MLKKNKKMKNRGVGDAVLAALALGSNLALIFCSTIIFTFMATKIPAIASALTGGSAQVSGVPMRMATAGAIKGALASPYTGYKKVASFFNGIKKGK